MAKQIRIRGQEANIRFMTRQTIAGLFVVKPLAGSFFKAKDFTWNPMDDITEDDFIGETATDFDYMNNGFSGSFSIDKSDAAATNYVRQMVATSRGRTRPLELTMQVTYIYRDLTLPPTVLDFSEGIMKMASEAIASRKDFINSSFEWRCKTMLENGL